MGATMTTVDAITKEIYGKKIVNQMENEITLTKRIEKTSEGTTDEVGGKYVTFPLKVRRNHGIGYRNELEQLQSPGQQGWVNVRVPLRYGYGRVHMSGQAMKLADKNYQAFASAMTEEMDGLKTDLAKDTNRVLWGNQTGRLATSDTASGASTTISVGTTSEDIKYIEVGMVVDILSTTGPTYRIQGATVTALDPANGNFTIGTAPAGVAIGDIVVRTGNYLKEPHGLQSLVNNSTAALFNLASTTEPLWTSVVNSTGGALSESSMIKMCDDLRMNGGRPTVIFTDLGTRRAYFNLLTTQRRFTGTKTFDGGFSGLAFTYDDDIPVVTDVDAVAGSLYFLKEDDFKIYQESDWSWEDTDGDVWKWVTNYDAFEALMKKYWEFAIRRRNTQGVMSGITAG